MASLLGGEHPTVISTFSTLRIYSYFYYLYYPYDQSLCLGSADRHSPVGGGGSREEKSIPDMRGAPGQALVAY